MMIALIILGFGLLIIGAALPVGVSKTREIAERDLGEAAANYGLAEVERCVRLSKNASRDNLFRPRQRPVVDPNPGRLVEGEYEPVIKVRPLITWNVGMTPPNDLANRTEWADHGEELIRERLVAMGIGVTADNLHELDFPSDKIPDLSYTWTDVDGDNFADSLANNPAIASIDRVYPPILSGRFDDPDSDPRLWYYNYAVKYTQKTIGKGELAKARDRRVSWTAFYRRASYAPGSDPNLYEVIVVATRRPALNYRYPRQKIEGGGRISNGGGSSSGGGNGEGTRQISTGPHTVAAATGDRGGFGGSTGSGSQQQGEVQGNPVAAVSDTNRFEGLAPSPWLVTFTRLAGDPRDPGSPLPYIVAMDTDGDGTVDDRSLSPAFVQPATMSFQCDASVGRLLPAGSIFIPARNDYFTAPSVYNGQNGIARIVGVQFLPHTPDAMPIYEVLDNIPGSGNADTTLIVRNNGFYPLMVSPEPGPPNPELWPLWVIPPAYKERDSRGEPVFENRSPILAVSRKYVRFREIP